MNKTEFREAIRKLLKEQVGDLSIDDRLAIVHQCLIEQQQAEGFNESNKRKSWTDEELRVILQHAPTKDNCMLLARAFRRGYGSIEQIFRWAATTNEEVDGSRPDDKFIQQIKQVARQIGWRAT